MNKGVCRFCGKETELIKAHVVPKCFYKNYKESGYKALDVDKGTWTLKQNGMHDNNILCSKCDNGILSNFEQEGKRVLLEEIYNHIDEKENTDEILYSLSKKDYNYELLRKFFISILWRASISKDKDFKNINLGPYEKFALEILKDKKEYKNLFRVLISKIPDNENLSQVVFLQKGRYFDTSIYTIMMHGYKIIIFVNYSKIPRRERALFDKIIFNEEHLYIIETQEILEDNKNNILELYKKWVIAKNKEK